MKRCYVTGLRVEGQKLSRKRGYFDRFEGGGWRGRSCQENAVIVTGLRVEGQKLSRKRGYCDRFEGGGAEAVKKTQLL